MLDRDALGAHGLLPRVVAIQLHEEWIPLGDRDEPIERIGIEWPSCIFGRLREGVRCGCLVEVVDGVEGHPFAVGDRSGDELRGGWQPTEHDHCRQLRSTLELLDDRAECSEFVWMNFLDLVDHDQ